MSKDKLEMLYSKRKEALLGGGQDRIDKIHKENRMAARERIIYLLDKDIYRDVF